MSVGERLVSMLQVGEYEGGGRLRTFFGDPILSRRVGWEGERHKGDEVKSQGIGKDFSICWKY